MSNYFKVVGPGLGKAEHCFPFGQGVESIAAYSEARMLATDRGGRVVTWKRMVSHPECLVIGEGPQKSFLDRHTDDDD